MATLVYVDQENRVAGTIVGPKGVKMQSSAAKVFSKPPSTRRIHPGKVFNTSQAPAERKGLGSAKMNIGKGINIAAQPKMNKTVKTSLQNTRVPSDVEYPEIETLFPYNPLDFENFDVPEEHKLSHLNLNGVQLHTMDTGRFERLKRHVTLLPSPMETPTINWESDFLESIFPFLLEEVNIELPPLEE